ncbi:TY-Chap domain-containing protein [Aureimonas glaciei]|uniref:TY-Chap N-terminal domain-containing protein n=1 Tax=Aureimonas glaciei TaxID=1776957 RepID=A0A917D7J6_9HYPH|nr:hypothetical protein [Aureimonas glaciei]GGD07696.1 hypothetical protein GCM10011335_08230 [Aureimonas glaciei]
MHFSPTPSFFPVLCRWLWLLVLLAVDVAPARAQAPPFSDGFDEPALVGRVAAALENITRRIRPGQIGYATLWDGNFYVQCRRLADRKFGCEAAGPAMQPSLARVLTEERRGRMASSGWVVDPRFGNYVRTFAAETPVSVLAADLLAVIARSYGGDLSRIETETEWIADTPCPPRNGYSQNLAGRVSDAPSMRATAVHDCFFTPEPPAPEARSAGELSALYGAEVAAEIQRLRVNSARRVYAVFSAGIGYVQCMPESPEALYCEAQSAESWPALSALLTPERVALLHQAGFEDPGYAPNYARRYRFDEFDDGALAAIILTLLHDVYGYTGAEALEISTEQ